MNKNNVLLLVKDTSLYFYSLLEDCDCYAVYQGGKDEADKLNAHWLATGAVFPERFERWQHQLATYDLIVLMDFGYETYISDYIRARTDARIVLFLWNAVDTEKLELLARVEQAGSIDDVYTFDPIDAALHNIKHNTTFYSSKVVAPPVQITHDIYFGGKDKNRNEIILNTKKEMEALGLRFLLHCPGLTGSISDEYIRYPEYLNLALQSKALLEILKAGQTGISLRSMEALFLGKKLITYNRIIEHYRFYHPDNVFIVGKDNWADLPAFIDKPMQPIDAKIIDFFDFPQWLARFQTSDNEGMQKYGFYKDDIKFQV